MSMPSAEQACGWCWIFHVEANLVYVNKRGLIGHHDGRYQHQQERKAARLQEGFLLDLEIPTGHVSIIC